VTVNVVGNDFDPDGDPLTVTGATDPAHGTTGVNPGGTVTYTPDENFVGTDTFTYTVSDGEATSTASVTIDVVEALNRPPLAADDTATTKQGERVTIHVLRNDTDPDGDSLRVTEATSPRTGTVTINRGRTITYRPQSGFTGTDSFRYTVDDGKGGTDEATVNVTVRPSGDDDDDDDDDGGDDDDDDGGGDEDD
jgi:hypothetical protein